MLGRSGWQRLGCLSDVTPACAGRGRHRAHRPSSHQRRRTALDPVHVRELPHARDAHAETISAIEIPSLRRPPPPSSADATPLATPAELRLDRPVTATPALASELSVLDSGFGYVFAAYRNVLLASWKAQGTRPLIEALGRALASFVSLHPEGVSSVHIIAAGLPLADNAAREALSDLMKAHDSHLACGGTVLDGTGFWASATRGVIMSLQMLTRSSFAVRTCASDAELAAWLLKPHAHRTGITLEQQALEQAMGQIRVLSHAPPA